ncbi:MAG: hypothetical protein GY769_01890 [bacterium]|nr:hypothetical protein [bacterium]
MTHDDLHGLALEVLEGGDEAKLLAASGLLPLPPEQLIQLQVRLTEGAQEEIRRKAAESLGGLQPRIAAALIEDGTTPEVMTYLGRHLRHPVVLEAILRRRQTSPELLSELAAVLDPELQEVLLLRQDVIVEFPELLVELEQNPQATAYTKRRINEYREHLLPRERRPRKSRAELEQDADAVTDEELAEAIEEVRGAVPAEGDRDETIGLTESQIRTLPIPVRLRLTRGASKGLRGILIKDQNPMVATSVLHNSPVNELEVEQIANNRAVTSEVLDTIGKSRSWMRKYSIMLALAKNPRTPAGMAARLVPRLSVRDLQQLSRDRNVANAVRSTALRLYRIKRN